MLGKLFHQRRVRRLGRSRFAQLVLRNAQRVEDVGQTRILRKVLDDIFVERDGLGLLALRVERFAAIERRLRRVLASRIFFQQCAERGVGLRIALRLAAASLVVLRQAEIQITRLDQGRLRMVGNHALKRRYRLGSYCLDCKWQRPR